MKKLAFHFSLALLFFVSSCKKEQTSIGQTALNPDFVIDSDAIDTFSLKTYTVLDDSLISSNTVNALLGTYNDPIFGRVEAEFYTQFRLSGLQPNFGDLSAVVIDSFVLGIEYKDYYGDFDPQRFEVYELSEDLYLDTSYYSYQTKSVKGTDLVLGGQSLLTPNPFQKTIIDGVEVDPQLRIFLDTNFARAMMLEAQNNPATFASNENFLSYFKGLNVKANTFQSDDEGGVFYFNLNDPLSKLTIYYRLNGVAKTFDFLINTECADFNHVTINNSSKNVGAVIANPALGQEVFYAQANQSRAVIEFPSISKLPKNAIIQYAKLELPVSYYTGDIYYPSSTVSIATQLSADNTSLYSIGVVGTYSDFSKSYVLDIRNYLQQVVTGAVGNYGLHVSPSKMVTSAERIVFNGPTSSLKKQPKLYLIYTTY